MRITHQSLPISRDVGEEELAGDRRLSRRDYERKIYAVAALS
jgi:hypothetical protein